MNMRLNTDRQLANIVIVQATWREATQELVANQWQVMEQAEYYGDKFALQVACGGLTVGALRGSTEAMNYLDGQAVKVAGGDISDLTHRDDYYEAMARRIAHHSGKYALSLVGSRRSLQNYQVRLHHANR